jgi:hypothetical protein
MPEWSCPGCGQSKWQCPGFPLDYRQLSHLLATRTYGQPALSHLSLSYDAIRKRASRNADLPPRYYRPGKNGESGTYYYLECTALRWLGEQAGGMPTEDAATSAARRRVFGT